MKTFQKTDRGAIIYHGIHDINKGLSITLNYLKLIEYHLTEFKDIDIETLLDYVNKARKGILTVNDSVDYIYENIKKLENLED